MGARSSNTNRVGDRSQSQNRRLSGHLGTFYNSNLNAGTLGPIPPPSSAFSATGGTEVTHGGKKYHFYTSTGPFTIDCTGVPQPGVEYVVIAGGGHGTAGSGGGGGAGGYLFGTNGVLTPGNIPITVGAGSGPIPPNTYETAPNNGGDSAIGFDAGTVTAAGGGSGGNIEAGMIGGSGGGGGASPGPPNKAGGEGSKYGPVSPLYPAPAPGQGNDGGASNSGPDNNSSGGGGGGAGAVGADAGSNGGGAGGIGIQVPTTFQGTPHPWVGTPGPSGTYWVCGGGGGGYDGRGGGSPGGGGAGGAGGGGPGDPTNSGTGTAGTDNTGGGGGGTTAGYQTVKAGDGGPGIVIIAYPV